MSKETFTKNRVRKYFGKIREVAEMPNLIEVQKSSYELFLNSGDGVEPLKGEGIREREKKLEEQSVMSVCGSNI